MISKHTCGLAILYKSESGDYYQTSVLWYMEDSLKKAVNKSLEGYHDNMWCLSEWFVAVSEYCMNDETEVQRNINKILSKMKEDADDEYQ